ncbi:unnamed protein product, partial [Mesorhabditis spiculigera]
MEAKLSRTPLIFLGFLGLALCQTCPDGWQEVNDDCIYIGSEAWDYDHVVRSCVQKGGYPAIIGNIFLNNLIQQAFQKAGVSRAYIGLARYNTQWRYANGKNITYQRWMNGEPRSDQYKGVMDVNSGYWATDDDFRNLTYACTQKKVQVTCDDGWKGFGDSCYKYSDFTTYTDENGTHWNLYNFTQAEAQCREMGTHLASIHSQSEMAFVYELIKTNLTEDFADSMVEDENGCTHMWAYTGLYHNAIKNYTVWTDGTPLDFIGQDAIKQYNTASMELLNDFGDCYDIDIDDNPASYVYWEAALPLRY